MPRHVKPNWGKNLESILNWETNWIVCVSDKNLLRHWLFSFLIIRIPCGSFHFHPTFLSARFILTLQILSLFISLYFCNFNFFRFPIPYPFSLNLPTLLSFFIFSWDFALIFSPIPWILDFLIWVFDFFIWVLDFVSGIFVGWRSLNWKMLEMIGKMKKSVVVRLWKSMPKELWLVLGLESCFTLPFCITCFGTKWKLNSDGGMKLIRLVGIFSFWFCSIPIELLRNLFSLELKCLPRFIFLLVLIWSYFDLFDFWGWNNFQDKKVLLSLIIMSTLCSFDCLTSYVMMNLMIRVYTTIDF